MSAIGPGNLGAINLAGSLAGAQQTNSQSDRVKEQASQRTMQINQKAMSANSLEDVGQADQAEDRDADGRMGYDRDDEASENSSVTQGTSADENPLSRKKQKSADAFGEKGTTLDVEA